MSATKGSLRARIGAALLAGSCATIGLVGVAVAQTPTGFLEVCKEADGPDVSGFFSFTVSGLADPVIAPAGSCAGLLELPTGQVTITELASPGYDLTGIRSQPVDRLVGADLGTRSATVTIVPGDASTQTIAYFRNRVSDPGPGGPGSVQICKEGEDGVTGSFDFTVDGLVGTFNVPVGSCSTPIEVPSGTVFVREAARAGFELGSVRAEPAGRLVGYDIVALAGAVTVVDGETTSVYFRNVMAKGQMKICKIAGPGIEVGTVFTYSFAGNFLTVPAGPASQGGFCTVDGLFPVGTVLTVTEQLPAGVTATAITINPGSRLVGAPDLATATISLRIGSGLNEVTYTNQGPGGPGTTTTVAPSTTVAPTTTVAPATTTTKKPDNTTTTKKPYDTTTTVKPTTTTKKPYDTTTTVKPTTTTVKPTTTTKKPYDTTTTVKPTTTTKPSTTTTKPGGGGDCTYTQGYYKNHEEVVQQLLAANGGTLTVAGHQLTAADIDYLYGTSPSGNYLIAVGHQLVTAKLNQLSGASTPTGVGAAITAAEALVVQQLPSGTAKPDTKVTSGGRTYTASELNDLLTNYNEGKSGPRHCG